MADRKTGGTAASGSTRSGSRTAKDQNQGADKSTRAQKSTATEKAQRETEKPAKAKSSATKPKMITLVVNVTVPENSVKARQAVYIAGNLNQFDKKMPEWEAQGLKLKKVDDRHWTATLKGPENAELEYKYTLGDWDRVERDGR